jgi:triacylglycerol lipase
MKLFLLLFLFVEAHAAGVLAGRATLKNPILLVHGSSMGGAYLRVGPLHFGDYWRDIPAWLSSTGTTVKIAQLTTDASIGERAAILKNLLETELKGKKVNIIAHSLGGLDARYLASVLRSTQVASITTIATPHYGTPLTDWALQEAKDRGFWFWFFRLCGFDMSGRKFLGETSPHFVANNFNPKVPDVKSVRYFSIATKASFSESNMSWLLWFTSRWLEGRQDPLTRGGHDGLVPLTSQRWGEVIAELPMDHLAQMNHHMFRKNMEAESQALYALIYDHLLGAGL